MTRSFVAIAVIAATSAIAITMTATETTTNIAQQLRIWKVILLEFPFTPGAIGFLPNRLAGDQDWGFTFGDLYGNGTQGVADNENDNSLGARDYRNRLWGQTALVTGANSGTGFETALALARLGVRVTMGCRNAARCKAARQRILDDPLFVRRSIRDRGLSGEEEREATIHTGATIDVSSLESVRKFGHDFLQYLDGKPLDMLFLNAGMGTQPLLEDGTNELSVDGIEVTFATNVVGHHLLYKLLEGPAIRVAGRTTPARIVLTSSCASYDFPWHGYNVATSLRQLNGDANIGMSHYAQSKLAQIYWARELTAQLDATTKQDPNAVVYANAVHPGAVATNIWPSMANSVILPQWVEEAIIAVGKWFMWTPSEGALTLLYAGTAFEDLRKHDYRGRYFHPQSHLVTEHPYVYANETETNELQADLWKFLDELVNDFV